MAQVLLVDVHSFQRKKSTTESAMKIKSMLVLFLILTSSATVHALTIDLTSEFDGNSLGTTSFGTIDIIENSGALDFTVTANTTNLNGGDIELLYFNLDFLPTDLLIAADNSPNTPYSTVGPNPTVKGGAGSSFDWGVNFGQGGGPPGNGVLTLATFTLSANEPLLFSNLMEQSTTNNTPLVTMAVHFQGTDIFNATSETVGGNPATPIPEPTTLLLMGLGLLSVAGSRTKANT